MEFISYSQNFEDFRLWRALNTVEKGSYLDIGAYDPVYDSVSAHFYEEGWRGVNIEPVKIEFEKYEVLRAEDLSINKAVSNVVGQILFHQFLNTGLSTADPDTANSIKTHLSDTVTIDTITLDKVFESNPNEHIHWMKIDVEGYEEKVLEGWQESPKRPWIVVLEATKPSSRSRRTFVENPTLRRFGYNFAYFDGLNEFYVHDFHKDLKWSLCEPISIFDQVTKASDFVSHYLLSNRSTGDFENLPKHLQILVVDYLKILPENIDFHQVRMRTSDFYDASSTVSEKSRALRHIEAIRLIELKSLTLALKRHQVELEADHLHIEQLNEKLQVSIDELNKVRVRLLQIEGSRTFKITKNLRAFYFKIRSSRKKLRIKPRNLLDNLMNWAVRRILARIQGNLRFRSYLLKLLPNPIAIKIRLYVKSRLYKEMFKQQNLRQFDLGKISKSSLQNTLLSIWDAE